MFVVAGQVEVIDLNGEGFPDPHAFSGGVDQVEQQSVAVAAFGDRPENRDDHCRQTPTCASSSVAGATRSC